MDAIVAVEVCLRTPILLPTLTQRHPPVTVLVDDGGTEPVDTTMIVQGMTRNVVAETMLVSTVNDPTGRIAKRMEVALGKDPEVIVGAIMNLIPNESIQIENVRQNPEADVGDQTESVRKKLTATAIDQAFNAKDRTGSAKLKTILNSNERRNMMTQLVKNGNKPIRT